MMGMCGHPSVASWTCPCVDGNTHSTPHGAARKGGRQYAGYHLRLFFWAGVGLLGAIKGLVVFYPRHLAVRGCFLSSRCTTNCSRLGLRRPLLFLLAISLG
ncbi:hypothetical protein N657DRAFT_240555 [Parathielavia appendiculata]|uniref:Uncharacterized protein n=1 Tax=Parathielavia appendiculata TaxID=2587402 RepID=A0AAN6YZM2_9PEZI|nr:hypothetical protein N657DRAFT_240555 [Parathielavia appendiculata]